MNKELLELLLSITSVSGNEFKIQDALSEHMAEYVDKIEKDSIGDGVYTLEGTGKSRILMTAHCDEIGLLVSSVTSDGYLKVTSAGGFNARLYPGHGVKIATAGGTVYGSVGYTSENLKKTDFADYNLLVDIGASTKEEALSLVELGDPVVFDSTPRYLFNDRVKARGLDDKSGVFTLMETLKRLKKKEHKATVSMAATVGEEMCLHGAGWAAKRTDPTEAIIVDVTYTSDYDGMRDAKWGEIELGKGPALCINPICDKRMNQKLMKLAKELDIPFQTEVSGGRTCTDADRIHMENLGIPVALVSIPLRYMHSPAEIADFKDIENAIRLLEAYVESAE